MKYARVSRGRHSQIVARQNRSRTAMAAQVIGILSRASKPLSALEIAGVLSDDPQPELRWRVYAALERLVQKGGIQEVRRQSDKCMVYLSPDLSRSLADAGKLVDSILTIPPLWEHLDREPRQPALAE